MKNVTWLNGILTVLLTLNLVNANKAADADSLAPVKTRVGTYNSRAVALAYGRSGLHSAEVKQLYEQAKQAEAAGDTKRLTELKKIGPALQDRMHRQVFGDAPIDDILEKIKDALPEIQRKAGVEKFVGKMVPQAGVELVDITPQLVDYFKPTDTTRKMIADLAKHPPLPPDKFPIKD